MMRQIREVDGKRTISGTKSGIWYAAVETDPRMFDVTLQRRNAWLRSEIESGRLVVHGHVLPRTDNAKTQSALVQQQCNSKA